MYYYIVDVFVCQDEIVVGGVCGLFDDLLIIFVVFGCNFLDVEIQCELDNNV